MNGIKVFLKKIRDFLEQLSSRPEIGGLQLSDSAIQYVVIRKKSVQTASLRLPPGIVKIGRVINSDQFLNALQELHNNILPNRPNQTIKVVVSLPGSLVYTQSFSVPNVDKERLEESADLNLRMITPIEAGRTYMSSQLIGESSDHYDFLGAFIERKIVDEFLSVLEEAKFVPVIFEFPGLALARLISAEMISKGEHVLVFWLSSDGLNLFILKDNALYFDYSRSWQSIQGESREITRSAFEKVVIEEVQKVMNFTFSHFQENVKQVLLITPGFEGELANLIQTNFNLNVTPFQSRNYNLAPSWFVGLGSALRGLIPRMQDLAINLGPVSSSEEFFIEQAFNFIRLWRNILAGVLVIFLITFIGSSFILKKYLSRFEGQLESFRIQAQNKELVELESKAREFNKNVRLVAEIKGSAFSWYPVLDRLRQLAKEANVSFDFISVPSRRELVSISGRAPDNLTAFKFRNLLSAEPNVQDVNLPLSGLSSLTDNNVKFDITFRFK